VTYPRVVNASSTVILEPASGGLLPDDTYDVRPTHTLPGMLHLFCSSRMKPLLNLPVSYAEDCFESSPFFDKTSSITVSGMVDIWAMSKDTVKLDELCINTIRFLAVDAEKGEIRSPWSAAGRGSHGIRALGQVPEAQSPAAAMAGPRPFYPFCRSCLSHVVCAAASYGYNLSLDDIKQFRQWAAERRDIPSTS